MGGQCGEGVRTQAGITDMGRTKQKDRAGTKNVPDELWMALSLGMSPNQFSEK